MTRNTYYAIINTSFFKNYQSEWTVLVYAPGIHKDRVVRRAEYLMHVRHGPAWRRKGITLRIVPKTEFKKYKNVVTPDDVVTMEA